MQKFYFFLLLFGLFFSFSLKGQNICDVELSPVCSSETLDSQTANLDVNGYVQICNFESYAMQDVAFYYTKIQEPGTFTFLIHKEADEDFDFAVWLNPNCANLGIADRASFVYDNDFAITETGLALNEPGTCESAGNGGPGNIYVPGVVRHLDVQAEDEIIIMVYRPFDTNTGEQADDFTISFGGTAVLDCTIVGNSYGKCDVDENNTEQFVAADFLPNLQQDYPNNNFKFYYNQADAEANSGNEVVFPLTVNYNGGDATEVFVRVETMSGSFVRILKIFLFVNKVPQLLTNTVDLPLMCNNGNDQAIFDLTQSQTLFVGNPFNFIFKYYTTLAAANAGGNDNIPNPTAYLSGTATVYVRIETGPVDGNDEGCFSIGEINLEVSQFNVAETTLTFNDLCDDDGDGFVIVDLTENITDIVANPNDYQITYHTTQAGADTGTNPIGNPGAYSLPAPGSVTIYVRIKSFQDHCYSVSRLIYNTVARPSLNQLDDVFVCDDQQDGTVAYDLTQFANQIVANPNNYNITYYLSLADAESGSNAIPNPGDYQIPVDTAFEVFIRVEANGCFNIGSVQIMINSNPLLNDDLEIGPLCDEDGDGTVNVNLEGNIAHFTVEPQNFQISWHYTQQEAENGTNPIPNPTSFNLTAGVTTTVYIRVKSNNSECYSIRSITYNTTARPVLNQLDDIILCVNEQGDTYNYDLTQLNALMIANPELYEISYFESLQDAEANQNPIQNPNAYPVPMNIPGMTSVFIRVAREDCPNFGEIKFWINSNPLVNDLDELAFCTNQQTGTISYDLTQHQPDWVNDPADYDFEYYPTLTDLENGTNQINNPADYGIQVGSTVTVYIKVINQMSGCYTVTELTLFPGSTAVLSENLVIDLCDENFDGIFEYSLNLLNAQLVADPNGLEFEYYLTQDDAENDQNPIPQAQWSNYQFNTLPATLWIVATTVDNCRSVPVFVTFEAGEKVVLDSPVIGPIDYCEGDEIDLTQFETQITSEAATFSYHQTLSSAQNGTNPIANTTAYHPQGDNSVYVRVEVDGRCSDIAEIKFHRLPTPDIQLNETNYELCPGDTFTAEASSTDPNPVFVWYLNDQEIGNGPTLDIIQNGTYTVVVTGAEGCTNEMSITVVTPPTPAITGLELGQNYVIVSASAGGGGGILEYSIDQIFWQNSPRFDNLIPGETYTVYVRQSGCMIDSYKFTLLYTTNFISPNGDGVNDTWEVRGIDVTPNATLKLFDRYGKMFVDTTFGGSFVWTGKYMGFNVASGDYWYIIDVPGDGIIIDRRFVGHVSVRNQ